jgi:hypothetical protein
MSRSRAITTKVYGRCKASLTMAVIHTPDRAGKAAVNP